MLKSSEHHKLQRLATLVDIVQKHLARYKDNPNIRDHMLGSHDFDPDPDKFGYSMGDFDLGTLHDQHTYHHTVDGPHEEDF